MKRLRRSLQKKEQLLKKNMDTIRKSYELAVAWSVGEKLAVAV